jgi:hypothetical protein
MVFSLDSMSEILKARSCYKNVKDHFQIERIQVLRSYCSSVMSQIQAEGWVMSRVVVGLDSDTPDRVVHKSRILVARRYI